MQRKNIAFGTLDLANFHKDENGLLKYENALLRKDGGKPKD